MKTFFLSFLMCLLLLFFPYSTVESSGKKIKELEVKGYVTQVNSPSSFEIDDYKITLDGKYDVELQNIEDKAIKFDPAVHIKVGTLVKMKCKVNLETLAAKVEEIKVDVKQFRRLSHTTVLDASAENLERTDAGKWTGTILADARRIVITPETNVRFKLNKSEEREAKEKKAEKEEQERFEKEKEAAKDKLDEEKDKLENKADDESDIEESSVEELQIGSRPLDSLKDVGEGVYMTYKGRENLDGSLVASDIVFVKNEKTKQEKEMWQDLRIKAKESKKAKSFDKMKVGGKEYKVLQEDAIQEYVDNLGQALVPAYQQGLPDDADNKIPFKFIVVFKEAFNASAYPTGTVVINHDVFNVIENEAQFAFLLSHEIAHATQEHALRAANHKKGTRTWLKVGVIASYAMGYGLLARTFAMTEKAMEMGYARSIENQSDRVGMATIIRNGYDPREAPRLWKVSAMNFGDDGNTFWSDHSSNAERRSYLMLTLRNTYANLDYTNLKKDSVEFQKIAAMIKEKYPAKRKKGRA